MKRAILSKGILILVALVLLPVGMSYGANIYYETTDLLDATPGEDLWQYSYTVADHLFQMDDGFTIFFCLGLYDLLDPSPAAPNSDWDVITWDPDPSLPDDGAYDALAWVDDPSLSNPFTVSFVWLGSGTPGSQFFEIYDYDWNILETGETVLASAPVPEPTTILLFGTGLIGLAALRKRYKK